MVKLYLTTVHLEINFILY